MPVGVSAFTPLANITLGSSVTSVTFSSISGSYRDLVLISQISSGSDGDFWIQFNGDTGTNYSTVYAGGNGSSTYSSTLTSAGGYNSLVAYTSGSNGANIKVDIMDYSATDKHKTALMRGDKASTATEMLAGRWANTSAINSIKILQYNTSRFFTAGSSFSLYGVSA